MAGVLTAIGAALGFAFAMFWEILWALVLGFGLSAIVQAVVSKSEMSRLLPDDSPRTLMIASGLGAASSSCSYAAVALARSIFRKGANFTAAIAFQFASTNLVIELGIIMIVLMGWQFALAEFIGGPVMIVILALLFKAFLTPRLVEGARRQAEKGVKGIMEGHAEMDMAVTEGPLLKRMFSEAGKTAISHYFVMDWHALWKDIGAALLVELLFDLLGLIPATRSARVVEASITLNYTTGLNIIFLVIATFLLVRFFRTGGPAMLRMMDGSSEHGHHHDHSAHHCERAGEQTCAGNYSLTGIATIP